MKQKFTKKPIQASTGYFTQAQLAETLVDTFADDVYEAIANVVERKVMELYEKLAEGIDSTEVHHDYTVDVWADYLRRIAKFEGKSFSANVALAVFREASDRLLRNLLSEAIRDEFSEVLDEKTSDGVLIREIIFK